MEQLNMEGDRRLNFRKKDIEDLPLPDDGKQQEHWHDTKVRGLYVLVTVGGTKTFYVRRKIKGRSERLLLGRFPELSVEVARTKAMQFHSALTDGKNLAEARRGELAELTLGELFQAYLDKHAKKSRKTWEIIEHDFDRNFADWKTRKLSSITQEDVEKLHGQIADSRGKYAANRALELIRAVFNKGLQWKLCKMENPALGISAFPEESRIRILQPDEFTRFFKALDEETDDTIRDFIMISLLTGARKANVLAMRWCDINFKGATWIIPGLESKNGQPHTIALTKQELEILERRRARTKTEFVFPGDGVTGHLVEPKRAWARILKRAKIQNLHLHDLRRSMASWMANTGANAPLIQSAMNHKDMKTTLSIYAHTVKDAERAAREKAKRFMLSHKGKRDAAKSAMGINSRKTR
jgi:integrase